MRKGKRTFASRKRKIAGLSAFVLAGVIGVGAYAFTAGNTFAEEGGAGAGGETVSGYTISALHYKQEAAGPNVEEVTFTATAAGGKEPVASEAKFGIGPTAVETWYECTTAGAGAFKCPITGGGLTPAEIKADLFEEVVATS